jgi:hypothetical protein
MKGEREEGREEGRKEWDDRKEGRRLEKERKG